MHLHYAFFLGRFRYKIVYRRSEQHANADYLSWLPLPLPSNAETYVDSKYKIQALHITKILNSNSHYASETHFNELLSKLKNILEDDIYFDPQYSLHDGVIFRGNRINDSRITSF